MKAVIINFPGTNSERDTKYALDKLGFDTSIVWHKENKIEADLIVLPGGFSHGDYLRTAAIAKFSPAMSEVLRHAKKGTNILGICNGFQMLLELNLLDGAMNKNLSLNFIAKFHYLKVIANNNAFLNKFQKNDIIKIPIAHGEGNYYADEDTIKRLFDNDQVLLTYSDELGNSSNPNGSAMDIAGICNTQKNVFGLMPHPERACEKLIGGDDGLKMLQGFLA
ncbi:MAG: phosphoribosylformylglycinamidine synthase subunit PurQ [Campylobacter sp.]|nr:phosphoribosylformylglycinamidine synthase subunit PurQ [Campylobacter sp.]